MNNPLIPSCNGCGGPVHDKNHTKVTALVVDCHKRTRFETVNNPIKSEASEQFPHENDPDAY